ncbi:hypothetical protein [Heyndrickxia acidicola]|uniref:Uncharacterized protein n=1 Tax=Heyndrickxia acidicola TaxID=209389 RepID=A0ABU6ME69_9BACI|nr:hypothetical protein [Heyndrickxia acidicola]MED1201973.1 hypothetical protein [Heyndrickxia acidicola]
MSEVKTRIDYMEACLDKPLTMPRLETMTIYRDDFDWMVKTIEELLDFQEEALKSAKTIYRQNKRIEELEEEIVQWKKSHSGK